MQKRVNLEQYTLNEFEHVAREFGFPIFKGQTYDNRISLGGNLYFQFGDLRIDTPKNHIVIEVESAGGVTNLVKYWYCLSDEYLKRQLLKPVVLLHIYRQASEHDYGSHLELWSFLYNEMSKCNEGQIQARCYTYRQLTDLEPAMRYFKQILISSK